MLICNSNLGLPEHSEKTPVLLKSQISSKTKHVVEILDTKYEEADLPAIIRENFSHLKASDREKLLSVLLRSELHFDCTLGNWKLLPVSFELKEGMKPYHGRPYPNPHNIDRNCAVLPLSLDDLSNHTTLMLKFCKNKPIGVLLLRHVLFRGGKGAFCSKKGVTFHP